MDILEHALAQRIGGADGELVEALCEEVKRLREIEAAARNLCNQKGRHNTEIAMLRLMSVCGF